MVVPHPAVQSLFMQKELGERRGNWVTALQEYNLEFKPASIIKGKGLCKLIAESKNGEENDWENEAEVHMIDICPIFTALESRYRDLIHYLQQVYFLEHWSSKKIRELRLKSTSYQVIDGFLFRKNYEGVLLRFLEHEDATKVVKELHDNPAGGH